MSEAKTPGQIAQEGFYASRPAEGRMPWPPNKPHTMQYWEDAANAVIELCAQAADAFYQEASTEDVRRMSDYEFGDHEGRRAAARGIGDLIRVMKVAAPEASPETSASEGDE
jgi:hypothetical protein